MVIAENGSEQTDTKQEQHIFLTENWQWMIPPKCFNANNKGTIGLKRILQNKILEDVA